MSARLDSVKDYILRISAGTSYDNLETVAVNDEQFPVFVNNEYFTGYILVRINGFEGMTRNMEVKTDKREILQTTDNTTLGNITVDTDILTSDATGTINGDSPSIQKSKTAAPKNRPDSKYFKNRNRKYSIVIQGRFKHEYTGDEVLFGVDSNAELMPIPGVWVGLRLCKWLDPALEAHLEGKSPHIYSPIFSCMNQLGVFEPGDDLTNGKHLGETTEAQILAKITDPYQYHTVESNTATPPMDLTPWAFANSHVPELPSLLFSSQSDKEFATTYEKRKKLFASKAKRDAVTISPSKIYCMDFYDAYFDLTSFSLKLPGFSINSFKYWDGSQPLRYVCKTRDGSRVFFVVQMVWEPLM